MRRPAGAEGGTDMGGLELMLGCFLEGWTLQVRYGIDGKLDVIFIRNDGFEVLAMLYR